MSTSALDAAQMLDRLRTNLHAAGIPATDTDFENFLESGSLAYYDTFEHALSLLSGETLPDYLAAWAPADLPDSEDEAAAAPSSQLSSNPTTIAEVAPLLR